MSIEKEVTIYDIAKVLSISPATVSRALNDHYAVSKATKKRIIEMARGMGYRSNPFATNLRVQRTNTIGIILHQLKSHFITSVLAGIEKVTAAAKYDLIIGHSSEMAEKEISNAQNFYAKRVDGIIASLSYDTPNLSHFDVFTEKNIPVVLFDRVEDYPYATKVVIDNFKAGFEATEHLIRYGCRKIMHITGNVMRNVYLDRLNGHKAALEKYGIPFLPDLIVINDLTEEAGIIAARKILNMQDKPDGVFVANDFCAAICMKTLISYGMRVPQDIAFVGFNNDIISRIVEPNLTTVDYPGFKMGEIAARCMIDLLRSPNDSPVSQTIVLNPELVIRGSSLR